MKENNYSLLELLNYKETLNNDKNEIVKKYVIIINEYVKFILEKTKIKNNNTYFKNIIIRGYDTITNVFNILLFYTKNLDLTFYHCQKAYYYYVEFIEQITDEQHTFLQLTSKDAISYVYKKIFSELLHDKKINTQLCSNELKQILTTVDKHIKIFNNIFVFVIEILLFNEENLNIIKNDYLKNIYEKIIELQIKKEHCDIMYNFIEKTNKSLLDCDHNSYKNILNEYYKLLINIVTKYAKYKNNITLLISKI
jgi:hypothetical protein